MNELLTELGSSFPPARLASLIISLLRVAVIFLAAVIVATIVARLVRVLRSQIVGVMQRRSSAESRLELEQRADTIAGIIGRTAHVLVWSVAVVMALREVGFDIAPILAGAGIVGLAVGFGAQNLVRDVISGLFMLIENQLSLNDVVVINGTGGLVEELNLRTTVLRGLDGTVYVFPNGGITSFANMTRDYSYYVFNMRVSYREDTDRVIEILRSVADNVRRDPTLAPLILEPLDVIGVDEFGDSVVFVKARIKTLAGKQWQVGREMNRQIKQRFDTEDIETPFPQLSVFFKDAPFKIGIDDAARSELRTIVREVMAERDASPPRD